MSKSKKHELYSLMNLGPACFKALQLLGIDSIASLAKQDADELYTPVLL